MIKNWFVYIIQCTDGVFYTGISTDVEKRYQQHANQKGAKFFRARKPRALVFQESGHNRSTATKREMAIKKLTRSDKIQLILSGENQIRGKGLMISE